MYGHDGASNNVALSIRSNIVAGPIMTIHWVFPQLCFQQQCCSTSYVIISLLKYVGVIEFLEELDFLQFLYSSHSLVQL